MTEPRFNREVFQRELLEKANTSLCKGTLIESSTNHAAIRLIDQGRWGAASYTGEGVRWLATFGANPCFAVSIYDFVNKRGALAHIDDLSDPTLTLNSMQSSIWYRRPIERAKYQVSLVGGSNTRLDYMAEILEVVYSMREQRGIDVDLQIGDIRQAQASLALDLLDGTVYNFEPHMTLSDFNPPSIMELQSRAFEVSTSGRKKAAKPYPVIGF